MEKKSHIQSASLVDLKAELFRKQEEFKRHKQQQNDAKFIRPKPTEKKTDLFSKKNAGVLERAQKDYEEKVEQEDVFEQSKKSLQAKAKLYEKISHGSDIPEEDGSKIFLVDFQKKVIDKIVDDKERARERKEREEEEEARRQEEAILSKIDVPPPAKGEEWVDYVDSFGRSRRCMKKDLADLKKKDSELKKYVQPQERSSKPTPSAKIPVEGPDLMSKDMYYEKLRQKWEEEEQAALNGPVGPTHYANVQFDEIRSHGTGYYQFSKDELTRQEQLGTLGDLRKQTIDERSRQERLKQKRKAMMEARLAKVKQRKKLKGGGLFGPDSNKDELEETGDDSDIGPKLPEMETKEEEKTSNEPELLTRDKNINKNAPKREWDQGKEEIFGPSAEERYLNSRRDNRQTEFAPPSFYYATPKVKDSVQKMTQNTSHNRKKENIFKAPVAGADRINDFLTWERQAADNSEEKQHVELNSETRKEIVLTREMAMEKPVKCENPEQTVTNSDVTDIPLPTDSDNEAQNTHYTPVPLPTPSIQVPHPTQSIPVPHPTQSIPVPHPIPSIPVPHSSQFTPYLHVPPPPTFPLPDTSVPPPPLQPNNTQWNVKHFPLQASSNIEGSGNIAIVNSDSSYPTASETQNQYITQSHQICSDPQATAIPRSSIIDTRLMCNKDQDNEDEIDDETSASNVEDVSSTQDEQNVFSSAPIVYSKTSLC